MNKSVFVKILGFRATLIHGDPMVLDRWLWLKTYLPDTKNGEFLLDIGCGTGAFTLGAAKRGYDALGLSWDERNQRIAQERAKMCSLDSAHFEVCDVRKLDSRKNLHEKFDIVICTENIEHIIDDRKLMIDIQNCLKPGGRLLLTTPYLYYEPITSVDKGPFSSIENGEHVRRGYTRSMLEELCQQSGLTVEHFDYCSGFVSQKLTYALRVLSKINYFLAWSMILFFRIFPPLFDKHITLLLGKKFYSICMVAYKKRFRSDSHN